MEVEIIDRINFKSSVTSREWRRFVKEVMPRDFDDINSNVVYPFSQMCRKFGRAYIEYLRVAWLVKDTLSVEKFCEYNGNVPKDFLNKMIIEFLKDKSKRV